VCNIARRHGIRKRYSALDQVRRNAVITLYKTGVAIAVIRERTGLDRKTIWKIAKAAGLPLRIASRRSKRKTMGRASRR